MRGYKVRLVNWFGERKDVNQRRDVVCNIMLAS